jgi:hypothetical protein
VYERRGRPFSADGHSEGVFNAAMACAILRNNGIAVEKMDFLATINFGDPMIR